jgi:uncharacterized protein YqeY
MLYETIQNDIKTAMKAGDGETLAVLRFVLSALNAKKKEQEMQATVMTDQDAIEVLQKEIKRRKESIALYQEANRSDLVAQEQAQLAVVARYVPAAPTHQEIERVVDETIASSQSREFTVVMKAVAAVFAGRGVGKEVAQIVKEKLEKL